MSIVKVNYTYDLLNGYEMKFKSVIHLIADSDFKATGEAIYTMSMSVYLLSMKEILKRKQQCFRFSHSFS